MQILFIFRCKYFITATFFLETLSADPTHRSSRSQMFLKIADLKNFAIFTGIHECWSLFLWMFLWEYCEIKLFYRTPLVTASVPTQCSIVYYLYHYSNKTLYLCSDVLAKLVIFLFFFCIATKQANICSKSTI